MLTIFDAIAKEEEEEQEQQGGFGGSKANKKGEEIPPRWWLSGPASRGSLESPIGHSSSLPEALEKIHHVSASVEPSKNSRQYTYDYSQVQKRVEGSKQRKGAAEVVDPRALHRGKRKGSRGRRSHASVRRRSRPLRAPSVCATTSWPTPSRIDDHESKERFVRCCN